MTVKIHTIELDEATAAALNERASERGVSVSELLAELIPVAVDSKGIAELDRRWKAVKDGDPTTAHDDVVRWLETWGTPAFQARSHP